MKKILIYSGLVMALTTSLSFNAEAQKKGLSKQGKGAIIGGAGGAVAGALIGGGKGAIIGGALGAGGGYVIGNEARRREQKRKRAAYLERRRAWKRAHPGRAYPY